MDKKIVLTIRLNKEENEKYLFIKRKIREEKIRKKEISKFILLSNSEVFNWCINFVSFHFHSQKIKIRKELKEIRKSIFEDKMELLEDI